MCALFAGHENAAPASCIMLSFADGSVVGYRVPLGLTPSGAWDKIPGSVLCLASDGNEIVAIGLSSGNIMVFDRHDMRAVFCSQIAQTTPGSTVVAPSRVHVHTSSSSQIIILLARFTDGSVRVWKLQRCASPGGTSGLVGGGFLSCAEAPVMRLLQVVHVLSVAVSFVIN
jgi:hypothetical protein